MSHWEFVSRASERWLLHWARIGKWVVGWLLGRGVQSQELDSSFPNLLANANSSYPTINERISKGIESESDYTPPGKRPKSRS